MGFFDFLKRRPIDKTDKTDKTDAAFAVPSVKVLSLLSPADIQRLDGIPPQAIVATYSGPDLPAQLDGNPPFVDRMHDVIRRRAVQDPALSAAARKQREGYIYIIDANTPHGAMGRVPPEDIIGAFKVEFGEVVPDSYQPSSRYVVFRKDRGLVRLPGALHDALIDDLRALLLK